MYVFSNQSKIPTKLIWQPKVVGFNNGLMVNEMASQILSLTREPAPVASRQPYNVINHRNFYFISQDQIPNNFKPDLIPPYSNRTLNLKMNQTAASPKNLTSNYNKLLENKN